VTDSEKLTYSEKSKSIWQYFSANSANTYDTVIMQICICVLSQHYDAV